MQFRSQVCKRDEVSGSRPVHVGLNSQLGCGDSGVHKPTSEAVELSVVLLSVSCLAIQVESSRLVLLVQLEAEDS